MDALGQSPPEKCAESTSRACALPFLVTFSSKSVKLVCVAQIIHRDLKLDNIFCTSPDPRHTKLIIGDLGIAVRVEPGKKTSGYTGTPGMC